MSNIIGLSGLFLDHLDIFYFVCVCFCFPHASVGTHSISVPHHVVGRSDQSSDPIRPELEIRSIREHKAGIRPAAMAVSAEPGSRSQKQNPIIEPKMALHTGRHR